MENFKKKVLIGSPIRQKANILNEFIESLKELNYDNINVSYCFVDDNTDEDSKILLQNFKEETNNVEILEIPLVQYDSEDYVCDEVTHKWNGNLVEKITIFKNEIINKAVKEGFEYLFLVDSDLVLHEETLQSLIRSDKDIISTVFWTKWGPNNPELPQVWVKDAYTLFDADMLNPLSQEDAGAATGQFLDLMRKPGYHKVGGLGACTLIKREPLEKGLNFNKIYNVSFWGEDRYFCLRAVAYGYELYVDTHFPAYHIYREEDLLGVPKYKENRQNRHLDILGYQVMEMTKEALTNLFTYDYRNEYKQEWINAFTMKEMIRQQAKFKKVRGNAQQNKLISKVSFDEWSISFYSGNEKISMKFKVIEQGYKNNYSYLNANEYRAVVLKVNGKWFIDELDIENKLTLSEVPIIRKAKPENKLTLSMVVKNEEGRYLERALLKHREYIDNAIIIDDGSTDKTVQIVKDILGDKNLTLIENKQSMFSNEINLRKLQWNETIKTNPDWILNLDADEIFEDKFSYVVRDLINSDLDVDLYLFRLYDFWDENNFRDDKLWTAHNTLRGFLTRYQRNFNYKWLETAQHCGRLPYNLNQLPAKATDLRLKHYGWAKIEDRLKKYTRYMKLDPKGEFGSMEQYKSILDPKPNLQKWIE